MRSISAINEHFFRQIHANTLIYNCCWEDPRCDRALLDLNQDSRIVMLTSAGCNALDYLLDEPAEIHCVDLNPRQNALLDLKRALFKASEHRHLFDFFGLGRSPQAKELFEETLSPHLAEDQARYWRKQLGYFGGRGLRPSFYWRGSSGAFAWAVHSWLRRHPEAGRLARKLFQAADLAEQTHWYERLEPILLNRPARWLVRQHAVQSLLGVPKSQQKLAASYFEDGMSGYIRHCLRQVFTKLPLQDNYFWSLYFNGRYAPDCCPNYLLPQYFDQLADRVERIRTYTASLNDFFHAHPGQYSHFILLDHQDWLAAHQRAALEAEWHLIFQNAAPGAKVLLRSAAFNLDFLPDFVHERVHFDVEAATRAQAVDRVGTYASTWIGKIRQ
jgi:S-adenosylmethionine-diacylglycerol 3-amino-3-carboxypropyl transferase